MTKRMSIIVVAIIVIAFVCPAPGFAQGKRRVGVYGVMTLSPPATMDGLYDSANLVAEVVVNRVGAAFECDQSVPLERRTPCTPTEVEIKELFKNDSGVRLSANNKLTLYERYGRVETASYYVEDSAGETLQVHERYMVFADCRPESARCFVSGYLLNIKNGALISRRAPKELLAGGEVEARHQLRRLKQDRGK